MVRFIIVIFLNLVIIFSYNSISFDKYEEEITNKYSFVENGVKLSYEVNSPKDELINSMIDTIKSKYDGEVSLLQDKIFFDGITIKFFDINDKVKVDIYASNNDKEINTNSIINEVSQKLGYLSAEEYRYIKVKVDDKDILKKEMTSALNTKFMSIENGYVAEVKDYLSQKICIALSSYNTGDYLLISTPIIYTSY